MASKNMDSKNPEAVWLAAHEIDLVKRDAIADVRRQLLAVVGQTFPTFSVDDAIGVVVVALRQRYLRYAAPEKNALWDSMQAVAESRSLELAACCGADIIQASSILQHPGTTLEERFGSWWFNWAAQNARGPVDEMQADLTEREKLLGSLVTSIINGSIADPEDLIREIQLGMKMARVKSGLTPLTEDELSQDSCQAAHFLMTSANPERGRNYRIRRDGRIGISPRAIKDAMCADERPRKQVAVDREKPIAECVDEDVDVTVPAQLHEALGAIETLIEVELLDVEEGSLEAMILSRRDVLERKTSATAFAREIGKPERTVRRAVRDLRRKVSQASGLEMP